MRGHVIHTMWGSLTLSGDAGTAPAPTPSPPSPPSRAKSLANAFRFGKKLRQRGAGRAGAPVIHPFNDGSQSPSQKLIESFLKLATHDPHPVVEQQHEEHKLKLPTVDCSSGLSASVSHFGLNVISADTAANLISGEAFGSLFDEVHVIDCRFEYEYLGGHIRNAINVISPYDLEHKYFGSSSSEVKSRICILFHCEYSQQRGPSLCRLMREMDRKINGCENYPRLFYPEVYLIEGGFKEFNLRHPHLCSPDGYVTMYDDKFVDICGKNMALFKKNISNFRQRLSTLDTVPRKIVHSKYIDF
eukprot:TRINITY_DN4127_c0_g2_i1.p1 TRINITY_DN4127_c0_g2~~TRINITY_DN4127_c0_g2_i1.p1  ORF type:complete len:302 (-),score=53.91 TRINITY_DN4127_c0_g2_i1:676-1581(-)